MSSSGDLMSNAEMLKSFAICAGLLGLLIFIGFNCKKLESGDGKDSKKGKPSIADSITEAPPSCSKRKGSVADWAFEFVFYIIGYAILILFLLRGCARCFIA